MVQTMLVRRNGYGCESMSSDDNDSKCVRANAAVS